MNLKNNYKFFLKNGYLVIDLFNKKDLDIIVEAICKKFNDTISNDNEHMFVIIDCLSIHPLDYIL